MTRKNKLILLKVIHTLFWIFLIFLISYVWYAGIFNKITKFLWICIALIIAEGIILLTNRGKCPLTILAYKYTDSRKPGFDIYLPRLLVKYNIPLFTIISILGMILVLLRVITR